MWRPVHYPNETKVTSKPLIAIDFAELPDGTLLDVIEHPIGWFRNLRESLPEIFISKPQAVFQFHFGFPA